MILDKDQIHMVIALFVVAAIAAILLGLTDMITREPIAAAQKAALHKALQQVLPQHSNDPQGDKIVLDTDGSLLDIYPAMDKTGSITALAWEVIAPDGYSGSIRILVGVRPDGRIYAIRVTDHKETPGLGDGIVKNHSWLASFMDQSLSSKKWKVKKDGGDFDQFTGATISPRAVVKAVKGALVFFNSHKQVILARLQKQESTPATGEHHGG
ncbi:MAG: RnfABCDGE type electron transport complex subunit G [Mariprofundus sp.]|nr:RnfABCDGE type electron transport complex subunit G [Mariprofundus sp.]